MRARWALGWAMGWALGWARLGAGCWREPLTIAIGATGYKLRTADAR